MKLTKTLLAAAAMATFALPMSASAQMSSNTVVGSNSVIGSLQNVVGNVYIKRGDQYLRAIADSAVMPYDTIVAELGGSAMVNLNGCNGAFKPCNQFVSDGNMVSLTTNNYCDDLAALLPMGPNDAVLSTAAGSTGGYTGGSIGTAATSKTLLGILGGGLLAYGLYEIIDDDDEPTSP